MRTTILGSFLMLGMMGCGSTAEEGPVEDVAADDANIYSPYGGITFYFELNYKTIGPYNAEQQFEDLYVRLEPGNESDDGDPPINAWLTYSVPSSYEFVRILDIGGRYQCSNGKSLIKTKEYHSGKLKLPAGNDQYYKLPFACGDGFYLYSVFAGINIKL